jgi:hypothetical protein
MKKRYKIGDKVKLSPDSEYYGGDVQGGDTIGEIVDFEYELPTNDDDIDQEEHYYKVKWGNGDVNDYRYTDLMPVEETIKKENTLKQQAVERFGFISKDDKFTIFDEDCDKTIKEENPDNWTIFDNSLYLANFGNGGLCIYKDGIWSERASLPKNWTVKCKRNKENQHELVEWRKKASDYKFDWNYEGWLDETGYWSDDPLKNKGIITYDQFLKCVYYPWKSSKSSIQVSSIEKEWKPKFKIGDRVQVVSESHGWGNVEYGDIGVVVYVPTIKDHTYSVNFDECNYWAGTEECFILEEAASAEGEFVYSSPMVRIITTNGISSEFKNEQSINLSIYKSKKAKRLKL